MNISRFCLLVIVASLAVRSSAGAETPSAWGIPLGVSAQQLRSQLGDPRTESPIARQPGAFIWTYNRRGSIYVVWLYEDKVATAFLGGSAGSPPHAFGAQPDPLGITIGDAANDVFVKTGSMINPGTDGVRIDSATLVVYRFPLHYRYEILNGYVMNESITLMK